MTTDQINIYNQLDELFNDKCNIIQKYLIKIYDATKGNYYENPEEGLYKPEHRNPVYAEDFKLQRNKKDVYWYGYTFDTKTGYTYHEGYFKATLLTYSKEELEEWANNKINELNKNNII